MEWWWPAFYAPAVPRAKPPDVEVAAGFIGQAIGWYEPGQAAGFITATLGATVLLYVYRRFSARS